MPLSNELVRVQPYYYFVGIVILWQWPLSYDLVELKTRPRPKTGPILRQHHNFCCLSFELNLQLCVTFAAEMSDRWRSASERTVVSFA